MAGLSIRHDIGTVAKQFQRRFTASNLRFGVAKTLTDLAAGGKEEVVKSLPSKFVIRRDWVPRGIRFRPATKTNLESVIYSIDSGGRRSFMALQQTGGLKRPEAGRHIAVPLKAVKPTPQTVIQQGWKPKNLLRTLPANPYAKNDKKRLAMALRAQAFKVKSRKRPGVEIILMKKGGVYVPAWLLVPATKLPQREFLAGPTMRFVTRNCARLLKSNLEASLK